MNIKFRSEENRPPPGAMPRRESRDRGPRVNRDIRAPKIRVVLDSGEMLGVMNPRDALVEAESRGLDLVEISPTANPPVCKITDFGKFKYELKKKSGGQKKQTSNVIKELTLSPTTQDHDIQTKIRKAQEFFDEGNRVKFTVRFRGRQMAHPEIGQQQLDKIEAYLKDKATVETRSKMEGRVLARVFAPLPTAAKSKPKEASKPKDSAKSKDALKKD